MNPGIKLLNLLMVILIFAALLGFWYIPAMRNAINYAKNDKNIKQHTQMIKENTK